MQWQNGASAAKSGYKFSYDVVLNKTRVQFGKFKNAAKAQLIGI